VLTHTVDYIFSLDFILFLLTNLFFIGGLVAVITYFMLPTDLLSASEYGILGYVDNVLVAVIVGVVVIGKAGLVYLSKR